MSNMAKKLLPLLDRVLVRRMEAPSTSPGGIMIPVKAGRGPARGEVVAVGPGARSPTGQLLPPLLKVGDRVILPEHGGVKVLVDDMSHDPLDGEYQLFREAEILARVHLDSEAEPVQTHDDLANSYV